MSDERQLTCLCGWSSAATQAMTPRWASPECPVTSHRKHAEALACLQEFHAARIERAKAQYERDVAKHGEAPYCRDFEDLLDGFTLHARECPRWPQSWWGTSGGCIRRPKG